jgi:hypothetical protein
MQELVRKHVPVILPDSIAKDIGTKDPLEK